jgi:hypothetical protein
MRIDGSLTKASLISSLSRKGEPQALVAFGGLPQMRQASIIAMASVRHVAAQNRHVS